MKRERERRRLLSNLFHYSRLLLQVASLKEKKPLFYACQLRLSLFGPDSRPKTQGVKTLPIVLLYLNKEEPSGMNVLIFI